VIEKLYLVKHTHSALRETKSKLAKKISGAVRILFFFFSPRAKLVAKPKDENKRWKKTVPLLFM